jgi:thymidylate kinase
MARRSLSGRLFIIEGPDGVGKSTFSIALADHLNNRGHDLLQLSFPGKIPGSLGELVYRVHHDEGPAQVKNMSMLAKQALHVAAHIDAIDRQIRPALRQGQTVLLDRYWWSAWVYGLVGGCDPHQLRALIDAERAAWGELRPTLAILFRRQAPINRSDALPFWQRLAAEYGRLAERESRVHPVAVVDNDGDQATTLSALLSALAPYAEPLSQRSLAVEPPKEPSMTQSVASLSHVLPLRPSVVYDTYWRFAAERQEIFFRRLFEEPPPWTSDPILAEYKFTNAYRASDRVSQYLIRHVIYGEGRPTTPEEVFFRILLFKLFNKIETWVELERALGPLTHEDYSFTRYDQVLTRAMTKGAAIYSAAYIMPSGHGEHARPRKHQNHLLLLERMLTDSVPKQLADCRTMQLAFELLRSYPGLGDFLAYQYVTDINYSEITNFTETEFVVPGPGALDGIQKCFKDRGGLNSPEIIKFVMERQEKEFERLGLTFKSLWGRPLQLIDCQNLFCEVDKYARVKHPDIEGVSGRSRIKQRFNPKPSFIAPWYPPKWGLNDAISMAQTEPRNQSMHLF